jgi:sugar lactone lactonase YvrE
MPQTSPYATEPLFDLRAHHGEGPVWDPTSGRLYWVDLLEGQFFRGDWLTGVVDTYVIGQPIGVLAPRTDSGVVLALRDGFYTYDLHSRDLQAVSEAEKEDSSTRFNDGAVDSRGRFWAATMTWDGREARGSMYRLDEDGETSVHIRKMHLSNGITWSGDDRYFFHADTLTHRIDRYTFDAERGSISRREEFIDFGEDGYPDGITIDERDHLWVAMWGGGRIDHYDERGRLVEAVPLPVTHPTSCCFGGAGLDELIVTTSRRELTPAQCEEQPLAGRCLRVSVGVQGRVAPPWSG